MYPCDPSLGCISAHAMYEVNAIIAIDNVSSLFDNMVISSISFK